VLDGVNSDFDERYNTSLDLLDEEEELLVDPDDLKDVGATYQLTCAIGDQAPLTIVLENYEANLIATN
jgi:hypothetical protein